MSVPLITIASVTYNAFPHIVKNIESIKSQSFKNWEHILADGGSIDGTLGVLEKNKDHFSWWESKPDKGIGDAMTKVMQHATGDWIIFIQGDDYLLNNECLAVAAEKLQKSSADIVGFSIYKEHGNIRKLIHPKSANFLPWKMVYPHQGVFLRREALIKYGPYIPELNVPDYEHTLRCYCKGAKFETVLTPITVMGTTGLTNRADWKSLSQRLDNEQQAQYLNLPKYLHPLIASYWFFYLPYKRFLSAIS